ncbi:PIPO, partial [Freesia mosaic virus]|uniref:PIPO n=1 Tax=Freesia mosaic virus TaxID=421012 RepID=UPI0002655000
NICRRIRQGVERLKLVGKILFNHFLEEITTFFFTATAQYKVRRYRRQIRRLTRLVTWKDETEVVWHSHWCYPTDGGDTWFLQA